MAETSPLIAGRIINLHYYGQVPIDALENSVDERICFRVEWVDNRMNLHSNSVAFEQSQLYPAATMSVTQCLPERLQIVLLNASL